MTQAIAGRERLKAVAVGGDPLPSFNDLIVQAAALALREFPRANGSYRDSRFELYSRVNVGIAVAAHDALVVPTIFDADRKGLRTIASEARALAQRVRDGVITPPELSGGTFTVSNLGMYGCSAITPVINPPQAAILGVGAIDKRNELTLTLVCDHRILYGADAARFLARIRELLEEPLSMAL
jgi:pyruvate dehydrogenase E2 component (dihydrolipoamide acetyltransferase)